MKTLIIHPADKSTDFLEVMYKNYLDNGDTTLISFSRMTKNMLHQTISEHDRIIMCGHGTPKGLFSVSAFPKIKNGLIIDASSVPFLRGKENIFIWCNADKFVNEHQLNGFYTGMFISEVGEATYCGVRYKEKIVSQDIVDKSNYGFVELMNKVFDKSLNEMYNYVKNEYGNMINENPVAEYNHRRLYFA